MVTKQSNNSEPPEIDEAWWTALLAEEEKYNHPAYREANRLDGYAEHESHGTKRGIKNSEIDWEMVRDLFEKDRVVTLEITGFNRGGLLVAGSGLHGFVPVSHLLEINCLTNDEEKESILASYVGRTVSFKVIECDPERGRVVFSERAALAESGKRNMLFNEIYPGKRVCGVVTNITEFGVFVDLGGVEGLIHVSELSWGRVRHPTEVARVGETVQAYVIQVDQDRSRIALSLKRLIPNPWETAEERYKPGQVVSAVITSIVPFGAFARLEEGLDGLIHSSEIVEATSIDESDEGLYEGQIVQVRILNVNAARQRLGLSLHLTEKLLQ
ncbi:MAG TPA: S1 RNA-binding domain-containing protein [Anaerolineales bacterium]|nr:S1 RNA-binding domain-containing protein [Anaerolineales bacterium]